MIRGYDLYARDAISPREKKELAAANKAASKLFNIRAEPSFAERWGKPVNEITRRDVELVVIEAYHKKYGH